MERRLIIDTIRRSVAELYPQREALAIAYTAAQHFFGFSRTQTIIEPSVQVNVDAALLDEVCRQLAAGCPVQYVTGAAEFMERQYVVDEHVLIPRPETEELIRWIIDDSSGEPSLRVLDVGTGSGIIAVSLALELLKPSVDAVDISPEALIVARRNALNNNTSVCFVCADALADDEFRNRLPHDTYDIIVSNPPYVPDSEYDSMCDNVRKFEPASALFVPDDNPLLFYDAVARHALTLLDNGGRLFFEIHELFAENVCRLLENFGFVDVECRKDINNKPRMVRCVKR